MISESILRLTFGCVRAVLGVLPDISWSVDSGAASYFLSILQVVNYMLPFNTVIAIVGITLDLFVFRIMVAIFRTLWDLIPGT